MQNVNRCRGHYIGLASFLGDTDNMSCACLWHFWLGAAAALELSLHLDVVNIKLR